MRSLIAIAPAKINLGLWILRRRPDGYHDILTLFQAINLFDTLTVEESPRGFSLTTDDPGLPTDGRNLVLRAASAVARASGCRRGARFHLEKKIPTGAGLGGGSSDAAAALVLLDRLWSLNLGRERLFRLAASIGADVPFFLRGGTAVGRGRGDRLKPLKAAKNASFLLVHGSSPISAKWAYSNYKRELTRSGPPPRITALDSEDRLSMQIIKEVDNQLEPGLLTDFPEIALYRNALLELGAVTALLTGSGSTVFGVFDRLDVAGRARTRLSRKGFPVDLCQSVAHGVVVTV